MSIHPLPIIEPATEIPGAHDSGGAPTSSPPPTRPDSGTAPEAEEVSPQNTSSLSEMPQDEVEVQRDSQTNGEIVVRYMDHAGNLILQVPTEQVLSVTRGINQDVEREQQLRAKAEETGEGHPRGESDGH